RTPPQWDLRSAVLFRFILDGNGRRCSARSPAFRARLHIVTICSSVLLPNQNENFGFTSTAAGQATTTKRPVACEIGSCGKATALVPSSFTWPFQKRNTTRMHGLCVVRSRFNSFSETCHGFQNRDEPKS